MIPNYVLNKNKEKERNMLTKTSRNSYYLLAKSLKSSNNSRITIFVDNTVNYEKLMPSIFNVSANNEVDRFNLVSGEVNTQYKVTLNLYTDESYRYLILQTANYCENANVKLISKYNYELINTKLTNAEFNEFIKNKTLHKTV